jgi:hypothetical protein
MFPSMPGGRVSDDTRRVPRYADAVPVETDEDRALAKQFPSMFTDEPARPAEAKPATAPATQAATEPATKPSASEPGGETVPEAAAEPAFPAVYADMSLPPGFEPGEGFNAAAAKMAEAGLDRRQAERMVQLYAGLQQEEDRYIEATHRSWRRESERLPASTLADARGALNGAPAELMRLLEVSRAGDCPKVIEFFARLRSGSRPPADDAEARARRMFPNTKWD